MAEESKLGVGYVPIRADLEPLDKDLKKAASAIESRLLGVWGKVAGALKRVAVAAGIAGVGAAVMKAAGDIDAAYDTIRVSTGKTGAELAQLQQEFKDVYRNVPADAEQAAAVIAEVDKRLGLEGMQLRNVSANVLNMSRILGTDAVQSTGLLARVVGDWGVANGDVSETLDKVFKASQLTGVGVDQLMQKVVQFGSPMRLMGFNLDDAIALFAKWEKEGVNSELVMSSLRIAAGKFASEGRPLRESLLGTFEAIQKNKDASAALALGMETFGARAGPDMVAAIREGRFAVDDLTAALADADMAIEDAVLDTEDWPEKLKILRNKVTTAVAPIGLVLMDLAGKGLDKLILAFSYLEPHVDAFGDLLATATEHGLGSYQMLMKVQKVLGGKAVRALRTVLATGKKVTGWVKDGISLFRALIGQVDEGSTRFGVFSRILGTEGAIKLTAFLERVRRIGEGIGVFIGQVRTAAGEGGRWVGELVGKVREGDWSGAWDMVRSGAATAWEGLKETAGTIWGQIVERVRGAFEKGGIAGVVEDALSLVGVDVDLGALAAKIATALDKFWNGESGELVPGQIMAVPGMKDKLLRLGSQMLDALAEGAVLATGKLVQWTEALKDWAGSDAVGSKLQETSKAITEWIVEGIKGLLGEPETGTSILNVLAANLTTAALNLGEVFRLVGKNVAEGIGQGVINSLASAETRQAWSDALQGAINQVFNNLDIVSKLLALGPKWRAQIRDALFGSAWGWEMFKAGRIPGRASGGTASGWTWVGERGPELLNLPSGSKVLSNLRSEQLTAPRMGGLPPLDIKGLGGETRTVSIGQIVVQSPDPSRAGQSVIHALKARGAL